MEEDFKAAVVWLILNGKTEEALEKLAEQYRVEIPKLKVGLPKKHKGRTLACYSARDRTISAMNSDVLKNPAVILHEFYHHLRTDVTSMHKGTERYASEFAGEFLQAYKRTTSQGSPRVNETSTS